MLGENSWQTSHGSHGLYGREQSPFGTHTAAASVQGLTTMLYALMLVMQLLY